VREKSILARKDSPGDETGCGKTPFGLEKIPSAIKVAKKTNGLAAQLKSHPFKAMTFSAACKVAKKTGGLRRD
jgi:hypothetical protein